MIWACDKIGPFIPLLLMTDQLINSVTNRDKSLIGQSLRFTFLCFHSFCYSSVLVAQLFKNILVIEVLVLDNSPVEVPIPTLFFFSYFLKLLLHIINANLTIREQFGRIFPIN